MGQELERLVLRHDDAARFEPTRAVEARTGDDHVEEERTLGGSVGNEREEARGVDRDDRRGEGVLEELEHLVGALALWADEAVEGVARNGTQAAPVEGHRVHREALAAVVKDLVGQSFVVLKHFVPHRTAFRFWSLSMLRTATHSPATTPRGRSSTGSNIPEWHFSALATSVPRDRSPTRPSQHCPASRRWPTRPSPTCWARWPTPPSTWGSFPSRTRSRAPSRR